MNIGLTGGIASGKTTVSNMLVNRGAILIDADQIAREVVLPGTSVLNRVIERFGQAVQQEDGTLHRKKLGEIIFADPLARLELEAILHPPIRALMKDRMNQWEREHPELLIVVDVPLLYESKLQGMFTEVMLIHIPEALQLHRLMKREGISEFNAQQRLQSQMPIEQKRLLADVIIDNSGSLVETEKQVDEFWHGKGF